MHFSLRISAFKAWRCIFAYLELIRGLNRLKINGVKILMYFGCPDKINTWRKNKILQKITWWFLTRTRLFQDIIFYRLIGNTFYTLVYDYLFLIIYLKYCL